jgi:metal-sulfur cluster biosynthetic enzyme
MNTTDDTKPVWDALAAIPDPEFGVSLVDLGLIYSVERTGGDVRVVMTLTTPTCPSGSWMHEGVKAAVAALPGVTQATVDLVFEPVWTPDMLSASARQALGWEQPGEAAPSDATLR